MTRTRYPRGEESWGHPLVSSPRVPGGLEESRRDSSTSICRSFVCAVQPWVAGSLVAMTKPVSRDAKLKGPKESTGRGLVNCASGKYRSSPIKPTSLDVSLEHWCLAKSCRCRSYRINCRQSQFIA